MKSVLKYVVIILVCIMILGFSGAYVYLRNLNPGYGDDGDNAAEDIKSPKPGKNQPVNVLVLGVDKAGERDKGRSDTVMLLSYNPAHNKGTLISIPRDTRIRLKGHGHQKINAAYAYEGVQGSMDAASELLGVPIHYYVKIDYKGFIKLVDDVGGVKVNVPINMDWDDNAGDLHIHLKKGEQVLDGKQALGLVRYRKGYSNQDLGRIETQQLFMNAFMDKVTSPSIVLKVNKIMGTISDYVETNMKPMEIMSYVDDAAKARKNIKMYTLPGKPNYIGKTSYFIVNKSNLDKIIDEVYNSDDPESSRDNVEDTKEKFGFNPQDVSIEVLNGGAPAGSAAKMGDTLKGYGFVVKRISNVSGTEYNSTQVINRKESSKIVKAISKMVDDSVLVDDRDESSDVDLTLILGKNYK